MTEDGRAPARTVLTDPAFRTFYIGVVLSMLGAWMTNVACAWLMTSMAGSAVMLGWLQASFMVPIVVLSLPAGALADRLPRRALAIGVSVAMAVVCLSLFGFGVSGRITVPILLCHTCAIGAATAFLGPATQAIIQDIAPPRLLPEAVTLYSLALNGGRAAGPALAGLIIGAFGAGWAVLGNTFAYGAFALSLWLWRAPPQAPAGTGGLGAAVLGSLRYMLASRAILLLLARLLAFLICASGLLAVMPVVARGQVGPGPQIFGAMTGAIGGGALIGGLGRAWIAERWPRAVSIELCSGMIGVALLGLAFAHWLPAAIATAALFGAAWTNAAITFQSTVQLSLPADIRGRGIALYLLIFALGTMAGGLAWGAVMDAVGVVPGLLVAAAGAVLLDLIIRTAGGTVKPSGA